MPQTISKRLRELHPNGFWLYVDDSAKSREIHNEVEWLQEAGMLEVSNPTENGGFSDVALPRLMVRGDAFAGQTLRNFIKFLKDLNDKFLEEENSGSLKTTPGR